MRIIKIILGLACLVAAVWLGLAVFAGFSQKLTDLRTASAFAVFSLGLAAAGVFLVVKRHSPLSGKEKILVAVVLAGGIVGLVWQVRSHSKIAEETARKMLRDMDEEMAKKGFVKVGENSWELPKNAGTNRPNAGETNTVSKP